MTATWPSYGNVLNPRQILLVPGWNLIDRRKSEFSSHFLNQLQYKTFRPEMKLFVFFSWDSVVSDLIGDEKLSKEEKTKKIPFCRRDPLFLQKICVIFNRGCGFWFLFSEWVCELWARDRWVWTHCWYGTFTRVFIGLNISKSFLFMFSLLHLCILNLYLGAHL